MLDAATVLAPVFVQVALTLGLLTWGGYLRVKAVRSGLVHPRDVALRQANWPPRATQIINAYANQLELPLLFYVVVILELLTATASRVTVVLAWLFVVCRLGHALIHVTTNHMSRRFFWFVGSWVTLIAMWLVLAAKILFG